MAGGTRALPPHRHPKSLFRGWGQRDETEEKQESGGGTVLPSPARPRVLGESGR